jgi:hypothetical protein
VLPGVRTLLPTQAWPCGAHKDRFLAAVRRAGEGAFVGVASDF